MSPAKPLLPADPAIDTPPRKTYSVDELARGAVRGGAVPPIVTKAGLRAFEVTYRAGQRGGGSSNANFDIAPAAFFPSHQVRVAFKLWFDDSFPWTPTPASPRIGGKLGGLRVGQGKASGGAFSATAASARLTWANEGGVLAYLYPQLRRDYRDDDSSNISWELLDQTPAFQKVSAINKGVHVFMPPGGKKRGRFRLVMRKGQWNDVQMFCRLNAVGKYDGVLEIVVNGVTERVDQVRYRHTDVPLTSWLFHTFFGGSQRPPTDTKAWFADFTFSKG